MARLLFEKTGSAVWISHLELMRLFQRAFKRAGFPLTHTQGYNPRPSVSIALPLSVGTQSHCELLDFELEGGIGDVEFLREKLNRALVSGVRVLEVYETGRKLKELATMSCRITLFYDNGVPDGAAEQIQALFRRDSLPVEKKSKNGPVDQDILPMIRRFELQNTTQNQLTIQATVCCQNPSLNPMQIVAAIGRYIPELKPDHSQCCRLEIFDSNEITFR